MYHRLWPSSLSIWACSLRKSPTIEYSTEDSKYAHRHLNDICVSACRGMYVADWQRSGRDVYAYLNSWHTSNKRYFNLLVFGHVHEGHFYWLPNFPGKEG